MSPQSALKQLQNVIDLLAGQLSNDCTGACDPSNPVLQRTLDNVCSTITELVEWQRRECMEPDGDPNFLSQAKKRYSQPYVDAPMPIMVHAEDGEIISINKIWTELTGYELVDIPTIAIWTKLAYGTGMEVVRSRIDKLYERDERLHEGEYSPRMRNGETHTWDFSSVRLGTLPDKRRLVMSMALDVTLRKQAEDAIKEANENLEVSVKVRTADLVNANKELEQQMAELAKAELQAAKQRTELAHLSRLGTMGEMATGLAHELNQPLTAVANYAEAGYQLLQNSNANHTHVQKLFSRIAASTDRAGHIIRSLKDMVRKKDPIRTSVSMNSVVADTIELLSRETRSANVEIIVDIDPNLPNVYADAIQIQQVVLNLMRNALEALQLDGKTGGCIKIADKILIGDMIELSVTDNGPGLDDKIADRIFESFSTTKLNGIGMGLAISKSIIGAHGGELRCDGSTDQGTVFRLSLPIHFNKTGDAEYRD